MIEKTQATLGSLPGQVLVDAGYCSNKNLEYATKIEADTAGGTEFFIADGSPPTPHSGSEWPEN